MRMVSCSIKRICMFLNVGPSPESLRNVGSGNHVGFWLGKTWICVPSCGVLSVNFVSVGELPSFAEHQFSHLRPGDNNTIEELCWLNEIIDLKHLDFGLPAGHHLGALRLGLCLRLAGASWYGAWSSGTTVSYQRGCIMHLLLGLETWNRTFSCGSGVLSPSWHGGRVTSLFFC